MSFEILDLVLFVRSQSDQAGPQKLRLRLEVRSARLGRKTWEGFSPGVLAETDLLKKLSARLKHFEQQTDLQEISSLCVSLCDELLPEDLQLLLWNCRPQARNIRPEDVPSLCVVSDEFWIPWDLLRLRGPDTEDDHGAFLAEAFAISRWKTGQEEVLHIPLEKIGLIDSIRNASAQKECKTLHELGPFQRIDDVNSRQDMIDRLRGKVSDDDNTSDDEAYDGWHLIAHGTNFDEDASLWGLKIGRDLLRVADLQAHAVSVRRTRAFFFLNACQSGRIGAGLTGSSGLPQALLEKGASAVVGVHWALPGNEGGAFAEHFYTHLLGENSSIAHALYAARKALREQNPNDLTWLSYTLFAHPLAGRRKIEASPETSLKPQYGIPWKAVLTAIACVILILAIFFQIDSRHQRSEEASARHAEGLAFYQEGRFAEAGEALQETVRLEPGFHAAWAALGSAKLAAGDAAAALDALRQAATLQPDEPMYHYNLGTVHLDRGDEDQAILALEEALRLDPKYFAAWNELGNAFLKLELAEKAEQAYRSGLENASDNAVLKKNLARSLMLQERDPEALPLLLEASREITKGAVRYEIPWLLAQIYARTQEVDRFCEQIARFESMPGARFLSTASQMKKLEELHGPEGGCVK